MATTKQEVYDYVNTLLGGGMVDVELDPIHYETALKKALSRFRQRSDNSVEESYLFLKTVPDQNEYILGNEVIEVRQIFRRSVGSRPSTTTGGGPIFTQAFTAAASQTMFNVNYNIGAVNTIVVKVNDSTTTAYTTNNGTRSIVFAAPLNVNDIVDVSLYTGGENGGGSLFDPFSLAYTNAYLLSSSNMGGLATYDMFSSIPRTCWPHVWWLY